MTNKFVITEEQKGKLRRLLTEKEFNNLLSKEWEIFFDELNYLIVSRFVNDEPTEQSNALDKIYIQIYNQN